MSATENLRAELAAAIARHEEEQAADRATAGPWHEAFDLDDGRGIRIDADTTVTLTIDGTSHTLAPHDAEEIAEALASAAAIARHRAQASA
jgi:hypothetical protein